MSFLNRTVCLVTLAAFSMTGAIRADDVDAEENAYEEQGLEEGAYVTEQTERRVPFMRTKQFQNVMIGIGAVALAVTAAILASNHQGHSPNHNNNNNN